jgi:DNA-binding transcriptional ArsR family regulator
MHGRNAVFRAMADPTRREILRLLRTAPRTSGEIAARFESSWPTVSRHLGVLKQAGLVTAERDGQEIRYELNTSVFQDLVEHLMEWVTPNGHRR